jgi:hypothetical protein
MNNKRFGGREYARMILREKRSLPDWDVHDARYANRWCVMRL